MNTFRPCKFTTSDDEEVYEGWTDGTFYNGWLNVYLERCQVVEFLPANYSPVFLEPRTLLNSRDFSMLIINDGREFLFIESCPIWTGEEFVEMYALDMEFMEANEN